MGPENRRQYFREEIIVPARLRVLTEQENQLVEKGLGMTLFDGADLSSPIDELIEQAPPGSEEEPLYRCLQLLNSKLDFIIEQSFLKAGEGVHDPCEVIELSGSGLKFRTRKPLEKGLLVKMNLIVPGSFQYQINLIAEILRVGEFEGGYTVAAKMNQISEEDRDSIIKLVLSKQRTNIRREKMGEG